MKRKQDMAQDWVDFKRIREQVGIIDLLRHYGLLDEDPGSRVSFKIHCPFHTDSKPSCNIHTGMNAFKCFGCGAHGGSLMLVRLKEGIESGNDLADDRAAGRLIQEWFGIESERDRSARRKSAVAKRTDDSSPEHNTEEQRVRKEDGGEGETTAEDEEINPVIGADATWFPQRDRSHEYLMVERQLTPETIAHFSLGYHAGRGMMHGRIVIPICNENGELVAYAGRWPGVPPDDVAKYLLPPKFKASHVVYNLHCVAPAEPEEVIIVEGFFDVIELYQAGKGDVIALMGTNLSAEQEELIRASFGLDTRLLVAFDADAAGEKCTGECLARLGRHFWVRATTYEDLIGTR